MKNILLKSITLFLFPFIFSQQLTTAWSMESEEHSFRKHIPQKYYDLKNNITYEFNSSECKHTSYTKHACMAEENFPFPSQFLDQTRKMMLREFDFRHKCNVAEGTNVAQLCIYRIYEDLPAWEVIEIFEPKVCRGQFYLSGNEPVSLLQLQDKKSTPSTSIDVQRIGHEEGYIEVRQRPQPHLEGIKHTVDFLANIHNFVANSTSESELSRLASYASAKKREIDTLIDQRNLIVQDLRQEITQFKDSMKEKEGTLSERVNVFMIGILEELITCLEGNDFKFYGMKDAINNPNLKEFIQSIQTKLSDRKLSEIFNSKYFNLGCSEPLLLFDLLHDSLTKTKLIKKINEKLLNAQLNSIVVQLHSTKTSCRSCLIGCCGHLQEGHIKSFFDELKSKISKKGIDIQFIISYHAPYEDAYPFYIPVTSSFNHDSILLVNMEFYNEKSKRMKESIQKEERLRISRLLMDKCEENKGNLTKDDIENMLN
jgi:hypothetical protein